MSCGNRLSNVRRLTILRSGKVFTSSNKDNTAKFYGEKKCNEAILFFFLDNNQKIFRSNLVLEVVFVPESEGLYYLAVADPGEPVHPHPPPPPHLILRPNWDPAKGRKKSFGDHAPSHLSMGLHDRPPPSPLISKSASDTVSYNLTCRFQPLHFGDVVVQLKYTRIASVSCFL